MSKIRLIFSISKSVIAMMIELDSNLIAKIELLDNAPKLLNYVKIRKTKNTVTYISIKTKT